MLAAKSNKKEKPNSFLRARQNVSMAGFPRLPIFISPMKGFEKEILVSRARRGGEGDREERIGK